MNIRPILHRSIQHCLAIAGLTLTTAIWHPTTLAQNPIAPTPATPSTERTVKTLPALNIPAGTMEAAVTELGRLLALSNLPELNVVYGPKAQDAQVPNLTLRNVSGADALQLIAVSADCELVPIPGADAKVVGWRVLAPKATLSISAKTEPRIESTQMKSAILRPNPNPPTTVPPIEPPAGMRPAGNVINFTAPIAEPAAPRARVYGLGAVTRTMKFPDVEETLRSALMAEGVPAEAAKLAFHEKTNVLIASGEPKVHVLIAQVLEALQLNAEANAASEKRGGEDRARLTEMMIRYEAEREQRTSLMKRVDEAEAQLREAQRALERMKASGAKP